MSSPSSPFEDLDPDLVPTDERRQAIVDRVDRLHREITQAATDAGRSPDEVTIVAVTKTFPASDVAAVASAGLLDVGENRVQEWSAKLAAFGSSALSDSLRWHYIGQLQTNKAAAVAASAYLVHSVDRLSLVKALNKGASRAQRQVGCLVQLSLDDQNHRGGVSLADWSHVAEAIAEASHLELRGVMAVAPRGGDPEAAFARVHEVSRDMIAAHPAASVVSTGMSGDYLQAIAHGATHVRVGASLLGARPVVG